MSKKGQFFFSIEHTAAKNGAPVLESEAELTVIQCIYSEQTSYRDDDDDDDRFLPEVNSLL